MIKIGSKAPGFSCEGVIDGQIKKLSLTDFSGKYKLLFFYPLDFTFVCPTELHALNEKVAEFAKRNTQVLGISVDSAYTHLAWLSTPKEQGGVAGLQFPLLSDLTKSIARDYDVLNEECSVALRGVFLLDKNDIVQYISINNLSFGRNIDELLRLVDALKYVEENGMVCPANWDPSQQALKPTTQGVRDYFKNGQK